MHGWKLLLLLWGTIGKVVFLIALVNASMHTLSYLLSLRVKVFKFLMRVLLDLRNHHVTLLLYQVHGLGATTEDRESLPFQPGAHSCHAAIEGARGKFGMVGYGIGRLIATCYFLSRRVLIEAITALLRFRRDTYMVCRV